MSDLTFRDEELMRRAIRNADNARLISSPNPWVGAVLELQDGSVFDGWTQEFGKEHAETMCLNSVGGNADGGTLYVTLEPCSHQGKTPPCVDSIISSRIKRVVVGLRDPDLLVDGDGIRKLQSAGVRVETGCMSELIEEQLRPYLHHRKTGRPFVILKIASTLDGGIAAADKTSQWITGPEARKEAHKLRAYSDAICVGKGTVLADNPKLTVRDWAPENQDISITDPKRVVLGKVPESAEVHPCLEHESEIEDLLDSLGKDGVMQLLVEGGAKTYKKFHDSGFVNQYEIFFAPAFIGGNNALQIFDGDGVKTISDIWRGTVQRVDQLGNDIKISIIPEDQ